MDIALYK